MRYQGLDHDNPRLLPAPERCHQTISMWNCPLQKSTPIRPISAEGQLPADWAAIRFHGEAAYKLESSDRIAGQSEAMFQRRGLKRQRAALCNLGLPGLAIEGVGQLEFLGTAGEGIAQLLERRRGPASSARTSPPRRIRHPPRSETLGNRLVHSLAGRAVEEDVLGVGGRP